MNAPDTAAPTDAYLTLPLAGVQAIEASAGTGTTFTLATLVLRLVVEQRLTGGAIPRHHSFALVGHTDRRDARRAARLIDRRARGLQGKRPDLPRVMFHPARARIDLREFALHRRHRGKPARARHRETDRA